MRNHTLMQTITGANRVFPGKQSGVIVDYAGEGPNDLWRWQRWKESGQRQAPTSSLRLIRKKEKAPAKLRDLLKALIRMDGLSGSLNFMILNRCSIRLEWQASVSDT
jgi:type I site-specific restriction-modification system R (restriction) subunit